MNFIDAVSRLELMRDGYVFRQQWIKEGGKDPINVEDGNLMFPDHMTIDDVISNDWRSECLTTIGRRESD